MLEGLSTSISVKTNRGRYRAGGTIRGTVVLEVKKKIMVRSIKIETRFAEHLFLAPASGAQDGQHDMSCFFWKKTIPLSGECTLEPGTHELPFSIKLKNSLPPSFDGTLLRIGYEIIAGVDLPLCPDIAAGCVVKVGPSKRLKSRETENPSPLKILSRNASIDEHGNLTSTDDSPSVRLEFDRSVFRSSDKYTGKLTLGGRLDDLRNITIWVQPVETVHRDLTHTIGRGARFTTGLTTNDQRNLEFALPLPRNPVPTIEGRRSSVRWELGCDLDIAWSPDVHASGLIGVINDSPRWKVHKLLCLEFDENLGSGL